ncbi:MAG: alpha/beta hydrolase [Myxococcota bacterium]
MIPTLLAALWACAPRYAFLPPIAPTDLKAALPLQRDDDLGIAYVDSGGDGPVLLFVHGLSSSLSFWDRQLVAFAGDYRVVAVDLPGYGASDRPDAPCTPPWYADQVVALLDDLGIERVTWVGHSMGGQIGMHAVLRHPERIDRLVLAAPAGFERFTLGEGAWMKRYFTEGRALEADEPAIRANFHNVFAVQDDLTERWIEERVRLAKTEAFAGTSVAVSRSVAGMLDFPVYDRLPEITLPVLIVYGTRDALIPNPIFHGGRTRGVGELGLERLPDAELVMIPGAGHGVQHDAPEAFDAAMRGFLESHP